MGKKLISTMFAVAMLVASAGQAMAQSNGEVTSGSVDLTNAPATNVTLSNASVTPFSVDAGGGTWDYGTRMVGPWTKKVWSNYNHPTKTHSSSCSIGTASNDSGDTKKGTTSYSSATGSPRDATKAHWHAFTPSKP